MALLCRVLSILAIASCLYAQDANSQNAQSPINTDRPAFADSSVVVPKQSLQIENGFLDTSAQGHNTFDFPESQWRFGLADKTELRFSAPDYYESAISFPGFASGWSDLSVGVKQQLEPFYGFDLSVVVELSFPVGATRISSHGYDPEVQLPWSRKLSANWTAAGMFSIYWPTQNGMRNTTGQVTFLFDRQLTAPWDAFIEYAGDFAERGGPQRILHFGTAYKVTARQQLDFHVGAGLSSAAPSHFIGVGYSILLHSAH